MVFEKIVQPDSADDVARVVYSRRPAAEAARVNNSRHTCCCIYFSKTINARKARKDAPRRVATTERKQPMFGTTPALTPKGRSIVATRRRNITHVYRGLKPTAKFTIVATRRRKCAFHAKIWDARLNSDNCHATP